MTKKRTLWVVIGVLLILSVAFLGFSIYQNRQEQIIKAQETERIEQEEAQQQKIVQEQLAQEQAALESIRNQLISGNYDENLKVAFLTFDDGPAECSNEVLDILARNGVKATFFTNGVGRSEYADIYKRIVSEGHVLANHSYSHDYSLYNNSQAFLDDVIAQENNIRAITGIEPVKVFRFPGGSNMTGLDTINALRSLGYNYYDWTASAGDGASEILPTEGVISKIMGEVHQKPVAVILCHGEKPEKTTTREALEPLINQLKAEGYTFLTLDPAYELSDAKFDV